jgi:hypothetical protein
MQLEEVAVVAMEMEQTIQKQEDQAEAVVEQQVFQAHLVH